MKRINKYLYVLLCVALIFSACGISAVYADEAYKITFVTDEHVSVTVSTTQDFGTEANLTQNASEGYARDGRSGDKRFYRQRFIDHSSRDHNVKSTSVCDLP